MTTFACHARYIGEQGEHGTPEFYQRVGFGGAVMYDGPLPVLSPPSDELIAKWLDEERARFQGGGKPFYPGHELCP